VELVSRSVSPALGCCSTGFVIGAAHLTRRTTSGNTLPRQRGRRISIEDYFPQMKRRRLRLREKNGKLNGMLRHCELEESNAKMTVLYAHRSEDIGVSEVERIWT
jgi:hypothetical protein